MMNAESSTKQDLASLTVSHVADFNRRYPGEVVIFYTRVDVRKSLSGITVSVTVPQGLKLETYRAPSNHGSAVLEVEPDTGDSSLIWNLKEDLLAGTRYDYEVEARVVPTEENQTLTSRAGVTSEGPDGDMTSDEEMAMIAVSAKGGYLKYIPAIYHDDELMGRFLMLFESFWDPIEMQIDNLPYYFDPQLAPPDFLPWLASWIGLALDERWPEEGRRLLLRSAASLYRKRGTKQGLQEYLEIYTGERARIIEHRAYNFCLGSQARLGPGIALGTSNMPHTFAVILHLPPASSSEDEDERTRQELERRRIIESIIKAERPAHTRYTLRIETDSET
jgi:phage tail-like protein